MSLPIKLISTDFDGTLFAEFASPPIPERLQALLGTFQARGARWVINTGRDKSGIMEGLERADLAIEPDYLVLVEREIHPHGDSEFPGLEEWNLACSKAHAELFARVTAELPRISAWVSARFDARLYEDDYSPLCLNTANNGDMDAIREFLEDYSQSIPGLAVVRNDVYARLSHSAYNKGTALGELTRRLGLTSAQVFAAGDHMNDLPMLSRAYARFLAAPGNAVEKVKEAVRRQEGYVSELCHGDGIAEALALRLDDELAAETRADIKQ